MSDGVKKVLIFICVGFGSWCAVLFVGQLAWGYIANIIADKVVEKLEQRQAICDLRGLQE